MVKAYLQKDGEPELLLEEVSLIETEDRHVRISTLFGESREIDAVIREIDFQSGRVIMQELR